jgi:hypothetical protein
MKPSNAVYIGSASFIVLLRPKLALGLGLVVVVIGLAYFVPVIYIPAVPESGCNGLCASGGHAQYYVSISYRLIRQGAWYWPGRPSGTYELINTPFGSFG